MQDFHDFLSLSSGRFLETTIYFEKWWWNGETILEHVLQLIIPIHFKNLTYLDYNISFTQIDIFMCFIL